MEARSPLEGSGWQELQRRTLRGKRRRRGKREYYQRKNSPDELSVVLRNDAYVGCLTHYYMVVHNLGLKKN